MPDEKKEGFVPRVAEPVADPVGEEVAKVLEEKKAEEPKPPEPKVTAQILITTFDTAPMQVQSTLARDVTILLLGEARKIMAKAIAEGKD